MIEAVMLWNEPNNLSHWDFQLDPEWRMFSRMARLAGAAVRAEAKRRKIRQSDNYSEKENR